MKKLLGAAVAVLLLAPVPVSAATLIIEDGELKGATGVTVLGNLYDVKFVEGTCAATFSGCDAPTDFAFAGYWEAGFAAQSLLDQVFLENYDSQPDLTYGCSSTASCLAWVPYLRSGDAVSARIAVNDPVDSSDYVGTGTAHAVLSDFGLFGTNVWARFTPAVVPEPATWALLFAGFGLVGGAMRRRKVSVAYT